MSIEGITATLEERGLIWQGSGFALIGAGSLLVLSIYSEADHWSIGIFRLAATQLNWAFVLSIALVIERVRKMFETREEIRKAARTKFIADQVEKAERRGIKEGEKIAMERFKAELREKGVELSPEDERQLLTNGDDRKWWQHLPPFRKS